jgi:hypothetical protein
MKAGNLGGSRATVGKKKFATVFNDPTGFLLD